MYTDNAHGKTCLVLRVTKSNVFCLLGELGFHESSTPSLKEKVVHVKSDPYSALPLLAIPSTVPQV
jgi:hypothetical protein